MFLWIQYLFWTAMGSVGSEFRGQSPSAAGALRSNCCPSIAHLMWFHLMSTGGRERKQSITFLWNLVQFQNYLIVIFSLVRHAVCLSDTYPPRSDFNVYYWKVYAHLRKKEQCERNNLCDQVHQTINPHIAIHKHSKLWQPNKLCSKTYWAA